MNTCVVDSYGGAKASAEGASTAEASPRRHIRIVAPTNIEGGAAADIMYVVPLRCCCCAVAAPRCM